MKVRFFGASSPSAIAHPGIFDSATCWAGSATLEPKENEQWARLRIFWLVRPESRNFLVPCWDHLKLTTLWGLLGLLVVKMSHELLVGNPKESPNKNYIRRDFNRCYHGDPSFDYQLH